MTTNPGQLREIWIDIKKRHPEIVANQSTIKLGPELDAFEAVYNSYINKIIECAAELKVAAEHANKIRSAISDVHDKVASDPKFKEFASVVGKLPELISGYQSKIGELRK